MSDLALNEIERGWDLLNEGKDDEVLQLINNLEKNDNLTPEEELKIQILKGHLFYLFGKFEESLNISRDVYNESARINKLLLSIDAIYIEWVVLFLFLGRPFESWDRITDCKNLLKTAEKELQKEIEQREGLVCFMIGYFNLWEGNFDQSLEYLNKALSVFEQHSKLHFSVTYVSAAIAACHYGRGELDLTLNFAKKALETSVGDNMVVRMSDNTVYKGIADVYHKQGDFDLAIEYFERCLKFFEQHNFFIANMYVGMILDDLIEVSLDKNSPEQAQKYLDHFKQLVEEKRFLEDFRLYKLSTARILKYSSRTHNRAKAEEILKKLILDHEEAKKGIDRGIPEENKYPLILLCDYYIEELRSTNDMEILVDIKPLIKRLFKESERTNSYSLLAQTYLLQGMLSLLQMNLGDARRELSQAQDIAESHGLQLLAREISNEHDKLLEQLGDWENLKEKKVTMVERMNMSSLDDSIALIKGKRTMNPPELTNEEPVLLMILTEGGVLLFSYPFGDEWDQNSEIFGSFLSAFKSFSNEFFTEGLDRVKFGQFIVLMENAANFSICYLFKGQTYVAKKKLLDFTDSIQKNVSIMETLEKYYQTSQVLELKDFPFLEGFIKGIFIR
jgi:tetratricopeptide (TPR) repeat protein